MDMINYEDAVETALLDGLKSKFNINNKITLIKYLFSRCAILYGVDSIKNSGQFMNFIMQELCIPYVDQTNGSKSIVAQIDGHIAIIGSGFATENSLQNIYESISGCFFKMEFADKTGEYIVADVYIKNMLSDIQRRSSLKLKPHKNSKYRMELQTLFKLHCLNEDFCIKNPEEAPLCPAFNQRDVRTSMETLYGRYLHADNFNTTNVHSVTESQVRDYLYAHMHLIEDGMRPILKEFPTKEGRVDIVARDKEDVLVVIEVKTENDKRLIWQCMYYPDEVWKKMGRYGEEKQVRMITIAPEYPEFILNPLSKLGYVESYTYNIKASNNTIEEMCVEKFELSSKETLERDDCEIDADVKDRLDLLVNAFIYTRDALDANDDYNMSDKALNEVSLKLVEMAQLISIGDSKEQ
jgi:hypothetical protein